METIELNLKVHILILLPLEHMFDMGNAYARVYREYAYQNLGVVLFFEISECVNCQGAACISKGDLNPCVPLDSF